MKALALASAFLTLWVALPAFAQVSAQEIRPDPRIQTLPYDANQVVRLRVAPGYQLAIIFRASERVENVGIGDSDGWQVTLNGREDALFIKPTRSGDVTNMTVITDARVYNFELSSVRVAGADTPFTVRFTYPDDGPGTGPDGDTALSLGQYRIRGARAARPVSISDDGVTTWIEWHEDRPIPAVFGSDYGGQEHLIEGQVRNGLYVIEGVYRTLTFRLDRQTASATRSSTRPPQ
ncbi:TrbG/VirB9 family P-type conjugative transfer protein [Brevundimonas sp. A19_0]|uniref:TrbG/VirB9 family P-type conjugative transfer protein n=1 Tax=Brevundimonas sp. A19_0 TaxID=2821087 RepID=UPI001AD99267|nr:TrbG/VirB9 family P-type conjugative transfer protein [Brevundimonas sp. A19_0]MBO9502486.1 TrbG/VirB9 family P-type conjugative transfer protein [Brevundimonas sp. A19_0]